VQPTQQIPVFPSPDRKVQKVLRIAQTRDNSAEGMESKKVNLD
jgi:hypothetical protein